MQVFICRNENYVLHTNLLIFYHNTLVDLDKNLAIFTKYHNLNYDVKT